MTSPATYQLAWPEGMPRGTTRAQSPFRIALPRAVADLEDALHLFGTDTGLPVTGVVITSNVTLGASRPADQGVAVYFDWDGARRCIAIDRFALVEANVWAIYLILEGALLRKSPDDRGTPFPGQTYPTASVTGMPSAV